jgi:hypothetical protein
MDQTYLINENFCELDRSFRTSVFLEMECNRRYRSAVAI